MKEILFTALTFLCSLSYGDEIKPPIKTKENMTYVTGGAMTLMTIPAGLNTGLGKRWYGDTFAFGVSSNLSASLALAPFLDVQCEALAFVDDNIYIGLQLGLGVGKLNAKNYKYRDLDGIIHSTNFPQISVIPLVKIIPFGMEWNNNKTRKFFHVCLFPGGASFNYGWEI